MFRHSKKQLKSKTMWFSWFVMAFGVLELNLHLVQEYLGDSYGVIFMIIALISGTLRIYTVVPLHEK